MKHFLVEITYTAPAEVLAKIRPEHREFLQAGVDSGWLLISGPTKSGSGGVLLARAAELSAIEAIFARDPYHLRGVATYRFTEFEPAKRQPWLDAWVAGE